MVVAVTEQRIDEILAISVTDDSKASELSRVLSDIVRYIINLEASLSERMTRGESLEKEAKKIETCVALAEEITRFAEEKLEHDHQVSCCCCSCSLYRLSRLTIIICNIVAGCGVGAFGFYKTIKNEDSTAFAIATIVVTGAKRFEDYTQAKFIALQEEMTGVQEILLHDTLNLKEIRGISSLLNRYQRVFTSAVEQPKARVEDITPIPLEVGGGDPSSTEASPVIAVEMSSKCEKIRIRRESQVAINFPRLTKEQEAVYIGRWCGRRVFNMKAIDALFEEIRDRPIEIMAIISVVANKLNGSVPFGDLGAVDEKIKEHVEALRAKLPIAQALLALSKQKVGSKCTGFGLLGRSIIETLLKGGSVVASFIQENVDSANPASGSQVANIVALVAYFSGEGLSWLNAYWNTSEANTQKIGNTAKLILSEIVNLCESTERVLTMFDAVKAAEALGEKPFIGTKKGLGRFQKLFSDEIFKTVVEERPIFATHKDVQLGSPDFMAEVVSIQTGEAGNGLPSSPPPWQRHLPSFSASSTTAASSGLDRISMASSSRSPVRGSVDTVGIEEVRIPMGRREIPSDVQQEIDNLKIDLGHKNPTVHRVLRQEVLYQCQRNRERKEKQNS